MGNKIPYAKEINLPFYKKFEVDKMLKTQYAAIKQRTPPSSSYFYAVWNESLRHTLYTMTDNYETGANHVIKKLHSYINAINAKFGLPPTLFFQMDNCIRENKTC